MIKLNRNAIEDILNNSNETNVALMTMQELGLIHFSNSMEELIRGLFKYKNYSIEDIATQFYKNYYFQNQIMNSIYCFDKRGCDTIYWFINEEIDNDFED